MIVRLKGQGPGAAPAVPRPSSGPQSSARGTADARPAPATSTTGSAGGSPSQALFDANGDGAIENWGFAHGGDSFATFDPPPPGTDTTRPRRSNDPQPAALHTPSPSHDPARRDTPAAIHHAHTAYRRDGLAGAPAVTPVGHDLSTGRGARSTAPPVPQPAGTGALRSTG